MMTAARRKVRSGWSAIVSAVPLLPASAWAAEEAGHHGGGHMDAMFFFSVVNFTLFVLLLYRLLRKPMKVFLRSRRQELEDLIQKVRRQQEELAERSRELDEQLGRIRTERTELLAEAQRAAEMERDRIVREAEAQAQRIVEDARMRAEQLLTAAAGQARDRFVSELLRRVGERLPETVTPQVDRAYADLVADGYKQS